MKKLILIIILIFMCTGCSSHFGVCRHTSLYAASVMQEDYEVVVVVTQGLGTRHAQAQAYIDDKWEWLTVKGGDIYIGKQEAMGTIIGKYSFMEYAKRIRRK